MNKIQRFLIITPLMLTASAGTNADPSMVLKNKPHFERHSTFVVCKNTSCDRDEVEETSSEIVAASKDGNTLIYTDSPLGALGFVDISDAERPVGLGAIEVGGEPTSVAVSGNYALVGVNTSESFTNPSGFLAVYDVKYCLKQMEKCSPLATLELGGQPDSVATSPDENYAAIVIENERDEDLVVNEEEGGLPQAPAGFLVIVDMQGSPSDWQRRTVELTGFNAYGGDDPEPEYVDINALNQAVISMQENNHLAIVDLPSGEVIREFSAGEVSLQNVDNTKDGRIDLSETILDIPREADAVSWLDNQRFGTANEGDFFGGSRGFSIYDKNGTVQYDSGTDMEYLAVKHGHYPEKRAGKKGVEPESIEVATYKGQRYLFVGSERGSFVAVYKDMGEASAPEFVQILPTGLGPEGLLAIPQRKLFVVAAEVDKDYRSQISIFKLRNHQPRNYYPTVYSTNSEADQKPIAWGALSGLVVDIDDDQKLFAVHDSFYKASKIYTLDVSKRRRDPAVISDQLPLLKDGETVDYDMEGITQRVDRGFWVVSEGKGTIGDEEKPFEKLNLLIEVDTQGQVITEIELPDTLNQIQRRFGLEGVTRTGKGENEIVYVAFQREWSDDPEGLVKIGRYHVANDSWSFIHYELGEKSPAGGWVGLSEIVALSDTDFAVIERDNQLGDNAAVKRIYRFSTFGKSFNNHGETLEIISKNEQVLVNDVLQEMKKNRGYILDKLEGMAITKMGRVYVITDNDGVDDSTGETQFLNLGDDGENNLQ